MRVSALQSLDLSVTRSSYGLTSAVQKGWSMDTGYMKGALCVLVRHPWCLLQIRRSSVCALIASVFWLRVCLSCCVEAVLSIPESPATGDTM